MTAYIAHHEKKNRIFAKREREMLHAIKHSFSDDKLALAAEKLRVAKINVFKCRFSKDSAKQPHSFSAAEFAEHDKGLERWLAMTSEEIVDMYRPRVASAIPGAAR